MNQGFATPAVPALASNIPVSSIELGVLLFLFAVWLIYTAIAAYHWFAYGGFTHRGTPALAVHIFVSAALFLYALSGIA